MNADSGNPFPSAAVARVDDSDDSAQIPAVRSAARDEAMAAFDAYLNFSSAGGMVMAVTGERGSGKTHLVADLLRRRRAASLSDIRIMCLTARSGGFQALYRAQFVPLLDRSEVWQLVSAHYATIVADSLPEMGLPAEIADRLTDGTMDPRKFVRQFGLMENTLLAALHARLLALTRDEEFSTAFTLLMRPGFADETWAWFAGGAPSRRLAERGIVSTIGEDASSAIKALRVFVSLYGSHRRRPLLVIDDVEKLVPSPDVPDGVIEAFIDLLAEAVKRGAFLLIAGLPDALEALGATVRDHLGLVVTMPELTVRDVRAYLETVLRPTSDDHGTGPFSTAAVEYLTWVSGGNIRRIIQICHAAYLTGGRGDQVDQVGQSEPIDEAAIRKAVRRRFELTGRHDVLTRIRQALRGSAFPVEPTPPAQAGPHPELLVRMVRTGRPDDQCTIVVSDSVLTAAERDELIESARNIRGSRPGGQALLVVGGYLAPALAAELADAFSDDPIVYAADTIAQDLINALDRLGTTASAASGAEGEEAAPEWFDRLADTQSDLGRLTERIATQLTTMRSSTGRRLDEVITALDLLVRGAAVQGGPAAAERHRGVRLPAEVEELLNEARQATHELTGVTSAVISAFAVAPDEQPIAARRAETTLQDLVSRDKFDAVGIATIAQATVQAFRTALQVWFAGLPGRDDQRVLDRTSAARLGELCRACDRTIEYLPLARLSALGAPVGAAARLRVVRETQPRLAGETARNRRPEAWSPLESLGARVGESMAGALARQQAELPVTRAIAARDAL